MPGESTWFIYAPWSKQPSCSEKTVFFEADSEYEARILSKMVGNDWGWRFAWVSSDEFNATDLNLLRETVGQVRDGSLQSRDRGDSVPSARNPEWERTNWAQAAEALRGLLPPEGSTELPNDRWVECEPLTDDEALAVNINQLSILASAFYEMLEIVFTSEVVSLDNRLNVHYLRVLNELRNCFENLKHFGVDMGEFQPVIPDLFPSTVHAQDWEQGVRPHAESLLKHAHRLVAARDLIELQSGTVAKLCVETTADVASLATEHARLLRRGWDHWNDDRDSDTPIDKSPPTDHEGHRSPGHIPTLQLGGRKAPWYIDEKLVKRPSEEQEAVIRALLNSPKHTLRLANLIAHAKAPHKKLTNLKKYPGWKEIIQMSGEEKKGYRLRCVVSPSSVNPPGTSP